MFLLLVYWLCCDFGLFWIWVLLYLFIPVFSCFILKFTPPVSCLVLLPTSVCFPAFFDCLPHPDLFHLCLITPLYLSLCVPLCLCQFVVVPGMMWFSWFFLFLKCFCVHGLLLIILLCGCFFVPAWLDQPPFNLMESFVFCFLIKWLNCVGCLFASLHLGPQFELRPDRFTRLQQLFCQNTSKTHRESRPIQLSVSIQAHCVRFTGAAACTCRS